MKFSRRVFYWGGIWGLLALLPMYFLENRIGLEMPPVISHPEFFYGFLGVGTAWQVVFLLISRDPVRYRALMIPSIIEKASFVGAVLVLIALGRVSGRLVGPALADGILGILFYMAYRRCPREA